MRGIAALAVCWYHFTAERLGFLPDGFARFSEPFGRIGVEVFFVISGFIIPFTLQRSGYRVSDYGTFLLKRIIRLDPPYLVAILGAIAIGYASAAAPGYGGPPFTASLAQVALHVGYLNVLTHRPWLNPVFWTLGVEVQYYLFIGLVFPLVASRSAPVRALAFAAMAFTAFLAEQERFLFHWLFLFMFGMAAFQFRAGILGRVAFAGWVVVLGVGACFAQGLEAAAIGTASCIVLGLLDFNVRRPLRLLWRIS
jgi:peptidoglycan/LPS O-acetylase OafA/YrhL